MQILFAISNGTHQHLDINQLQSGNIEVHQQLYNLLFPVLLEQIKSLFEHVQQPGKLVKHCYIKYWLRCMNLRTVEEVEGFFYITVQSVCVSKRQLQGIQNEILEEIMLNEVRDKQSRQQLLQQLSGKSFTEMEEAKDVFSRAYNKGIALENIAEELAMTMQLVRQRLLFAKQVLHLIFSTQ